MCQMCMTDAGTTQDNFILPAPPVGGLPISQDWLDRCVTILILNICIIRKYIILYTFYVLGISYIISLFVCPGF